MAGWNVLRRRAHRCDPTPAWTKGTPRSHVTGLTPASARAATFSNHPEWRGLYHGRTFGFNSFAHIRSCRRSGAKQIKHPQRWELILDALSLKMLARAQRRWLRDRLTRAGLSDERVEQVLRDQSRA